MRRGRRHCGAVLAAALLCLLLVMLFTGAVVRALVLRQRASQSDERQLQCFWLVESGLARAVARAQADPDYRGEVWKVDVPQRETNVGAVVEITVKPDGDRPARREILIQARLPSDPLKGILRQRELTVEFQTRNTPASGAES